MKTLDDQDVETGPTDITPCGSSSNEPVKSQFEEMKYENEKLGGSVGAEVHVCWKANWELHWIRVL